MTDYPLQNELIIQIMTESHEIDNLKRKVEDGKMKLVTEIKVSDVWKLLKYLSWLVKRHIINKII